ncbi:DEAD/DEAH box helicase [Pseudomonas putida]|uniref:DEAD/DEAH-box helicase domain-containing protein n=1 Tax=Pseudomonas putida TaxID=303 RepID=A0A2S3WBG3_PSEPU|nr:DEAD/DEAH box helicase [Pseudomonas putida]POF88255.1 hypothetical protein BGP80_09865 [Pseudomonas putida]
MTKIINVSLARPGTGKTKKACQMLHTWVSLGRRVLFAVPTISLAEQVCEDLKALKPFRIDSDIVVGPIRALNWHLANDKEALIVCQHAALQKCTSELLKDWTVIVDELPMPFTPCPITVLKSDFDQLPYLNVVNGNRISIARDDVDRALAWIGGGFSKSPYNVRMFSEECQRIYKAIIDGLEVCVSQKDNSDKSLIYYWGESGIFDRFEHSYEVHVLSATWEGTLFEWFAKAKGYQAVRSLLTPDKPKPHSQQITIYPMLAAGQCSKTVLNGKPSRAEVAQESVDSDRVIQIVADTVSKAVGEDAECLVFVQDWACLKEARNMKLCKMDSRGINSYRDTSNVLCMFHGNHVTTATLCLQAIATKYNKTYESLRDAWLRTFLYDATLQNVYRCSLRDSESKVPVKLYVQTHDVAIFLKNIYMYDACIDFAHIEKYRDFQRRGRKAHPKRNEIITLLAAGLSPAEIIKKTNLPGSTVYNYSRRRLAVNRQAGLVNTTDAIQND